MKNINKCEICGCAIPNEVEYNICDDCAKSLDDTFRLEEEIDMQKYYSQFDNDIIDGVEYVEF